MAGDLRTIAAVPRMIADRERIADHITNIDWRIWFTETGELRESRE